MKNIKKKMSALVLTTVFATMQISALASLDTGLGVGNGGAVINGATKGLVGVDTSVPNTATLNFDASSHVNWNTLNVNSGETLNFNAVNGASGLTVLNTVNQGMSNIYGQIKANSGISNLIISNPNGVLFDGAKFTTAGDAMITTQKATMGANGVVNFGDIGPTKYALDGSNYVMQITNSDFSVGGDLNFVAPTMNVVKSAFNARNGAGDVKFTTTNGQDYYIQQTNASGQNVTVDYSNPNYDAVVTINNCSGCTSKKVESQSMRLEAVQVNGDVYITSDKGIVKTVNGGDISGDLNVASNGSVFLNYVNGGKSLNVSGNTNVENNGAMLYARSGDFNKNLTLTNNLGFIEVEDINVNGNANLTTKHFHENNHKEYNQFIHVLGNSNVNGDLNIEAGQNIHIGGYTMDKDNPKVSNGDGTFYWNGTLNKGKTVNGEFKPYSLTVGGDLNAHTKGGHITTTINTTAKNINYNAESYSDGTRTYGGNILTDGDNTLLTAETYQFKANGYIGGIKENEIGRSADNQIVNLMEEYITIPADITGHDYMKIAGGTITKIETPKVSPKGNDVQVYIKSQNDLTLNGANAGDINLTAPGKKITITGDVHAKDINVGPETDYLKLDFPGRDFTTNYTSIRDKKVVTIKPDEEITYELADGGYNQPTLKPDEKTTYLIGPDPDKPKPKPQPDQKDPNKPSDDDNVRVKNWVPEDPMKPLVNTPVAFAADLDDDEEDAGVRKNVDGSVTVVRAFPMGM